MSDHVWVSRERATQLAELFALHSREVEFLAGQLPGDRFEDLRAQALASSGALAHVAEQLASGQGPVRLPVGHGEQRRSVGENTRRGLKRLAGNRGSR